MHNILLLNKRIELEMWEKIEFCELAISWRSCQIIRYTLFLHFIFFFPFVFFSCFTAGFDFFCALYIFHEGIVNIVPCQAFLTCNNVMSNWSYMRKNRRFDRTMHYKWKYEIKFEHALISSYIYFYSWNR